jgi:signal transduction histidine kinase
MSHELRTPLNSSLILARLLADNRDGNLNTEQVQFAETNLLGGQRPAHAHQRHPRSLEDRGRHARRRPTARKRSPCWTRRSRRPTS